MKGEAAYFTSTNPQADNYALWVLQLERQAGEWSLVAGYAGQVTTEHRSALGFSPVRGFARAVVAHAGYTIDVNRSVAFEAVVRQNGEGAYAEGGVQSGFRPALARHRRLRAAARGRRRFPRPIPPQLPRHPDPPLQLLVAWGGQSCPQPPFRRLYCLADAG